jgi:hypothetical protein
LQLLLQHRLVDGHKEVGQVTLEVMGWAAPVACLDAYLVLQPVSGVERAPAWNACTTVGHKAGMKLRRYVVVQQVVHHAVAEACGPHLAWLGVRDDEADGAAWLVGARGQLIVQLVEVVLDLGLECQRTGAIAFGAPAIKVGLHQGMEQVWICGRQQPSLRSSCGCCSGCRC